MKKNGIVLIIAVTVSLVTFGACWKVNVHAAENSYVQKYQSQKKKSKQTEDKAEEKIVKETLNEFYKLDKSLQNTISKYGASKQTKINIISVDPNKKREAMHSIIKLLPKITDKKDKDASIQFLQRYVNNGVSKDEKTVDYLKKNNQNLAFHATNSKNIMVDEAYEEKLKNSNSEDATKMEQSKIAIKAAKFNRVNAGKWAYSHYDKFSKSYPKFTGDYSDCTNFVSQALHTGGKMPFTGKWKIHRKNKKYWNINSAKKLDASWSVTDPSPWMSVRTFNSYMRGKAKYVYNYSNNYYGIHYKSIYNKKIYRGSVVIFMKGMAGITVQPTHAMIMSSYNSKKKDILLAGHSNERQAYALRSAIKKYSEINIYTF